MPRRDWIELLHRQIYKASLPVALFLSLPLVIGTLWYAWSAYAQLDRYRRAAGSEIEIENEIEVDAELFQLFLHDELARDVRRMLLPARPADSPLPTFEVSVSPGDLEEMMAEPRGEDKQGYVNAFIRKDGAIHEGKVRLRGSRHWHWLGAQKSLKVRVDTGDLIDGVRVFNLINDVTPFGLEEEIILDIAREQGLLAPEYHVAWLRLNNVDAGVYRYEAQPTEGLLRRAGRMPGSIYSGNARAPIGEPPERGVGALFNDLEGWQKAAWRSKETEESFTELERLLAVVRDGSHSQFRRFAHGELDLDRLALFDALDVVFGGDQHDYLSNHKLFFDAYRGRFEPIAWNFRAFTFDPAFNLVENPLLLRLKALPDYPWRRDRKVFELLTGPASAPAIRARVDERFEVLRPDLEADPHWDAYKLLARASRFHRFMVRPMSVGRWLLASRSELETYGRRTRYLLEALEQDGLSVVGGRVTDGRFLIIATVAGHAAHRWREITVNGDCAGQFSLAADLDRDGAFSPDQDPVVSAGPLGASQPLTALDQLLPGIALRARPEAQAKHGPVTSERVARQYRYFLSTSGCAPGTEGNAVDVTLEVESLVTGAATRRRLRLDGPAPVVAPEASLPGVDEVPALAAGETSPHAWAFGPAPEPEEITIGPGPVTVLATRVFPSHQSVLILPGTRLELGPGASLVFNGRVSILGTASSPVEIVGTDPEKPFGGLLLRGPGTAGSLISHLEIRGGSHPSYLALDTPSLINIYETRDITLRDVVIRGTVDADDLVHATYVQNLELYELALYGAPVDGIDIELSDATIRGARVIGPGDECLDLMGSEVRVVDSLLVGCTNNAISAGEETVVTINGVVIADAKVGVLAKNASAARISRSLIYRADTALRTNRRDVHYDEPSSIDAQDVYAVDCAQMVKEAKRTRIKTALLRPGRPMGDEVAHLRSQVLGLGSWNELDAALAGLRGAVP